MARFSVILLCAFLLHAEEFALNGARKDALERIQADSLKGHLSFLASDLLEGRGTPSRGLDIAAEYIAAQFRRAGLEPAGGDGYFQTANWVIRELNREGLELTLETEGGLIRIPPERVTMPSPAAVALEGVPVVRVMLADVDTLSEEMVHGKAVVAIRPSLQSAGVEERREMFRRLIRATRRLRELGAAVVITTSSGRTANSPLIDPAAATPAGSPSLVVTGPEFAKFVDSLAEGAVNAKLTLRIPTPIEKPAKLRNVLGILPGSDPAVANTFVLVSAHYDHLGIGVPQDGDSIYNGANDDASGTVSVIEVASALSKLHPRPRRSILFAAWFGEELGLLGSKYYLAHAVVPLSKTVAQLNLEHLGRTDTSDGIKLDNMTVTGYDYSTVTDTLKAAAALAGIHVYKNEEKSDSFYDRSDNVAFAEAGIPAHTVTVAFEFPDYHRPGDHWDKINFGNLEKVVRGIAAGVMMLASADEPPKWNELNPKVAKYVAARAKVQ